MKFPPGTLRHWNSPQALMTTVFIVDLHHTIFTPTQVSYVVLHFTHSFTIFF